MRHGALRMQELPTGGSDLEANNEQGNTFWATLDGRDEDGISSDGMVPPGDDLIEEDLKRVFSIDPEEEGLAGDSGFSDMDEVQVLPPSPHSRRGGVGCVCVWGRGADAPRPGPVGCRPSL